MVKIQRWWRQVKSNRSKFKRKNSTKLGPLEHSDIQNVNTESFATDYIAKKKV